MDQPRVNSFLHETVQERGKHEPRGHESEGKAITKKARDKDDRKSLCHHFSLESALGYWAGAEEVHSVSS